MKELSMRDAFLDELYNIAREDLRVILISADFGAPSLDKFRRDLSGQFISIGIAEQSMISIAAGLSLAGKIVFCYAILPFITLRCLEQIKVDLCCMNLPVVLVGVGAGYAYDDSGPTHHGLEDIAVMRALPNITILNASDSVMAGGFAQEAYRTPGPKYVRLDRAKIPPIYHFEDLETRAVDFFSGHMYLRQGRDLTIIATGYMVHKAMTVAEELARHGIDAEVVDIYRLKPLSDVLNLPNWKPIVTLEEHFLTGGLGSIVAEILADNGTNIHLKRFGVPDGYSFSYGGREKLHKGCGLDVDSITKGISEWMLEREK